MIAVNFINKADLEDSGVQFALEAIPDLGDEIVLPGPIITRVIDKTWRINERGVLQVDCFYYEMEDKKDDEEWSPCNDEEHDWVDARNEVITSGEVCVNCWSIRSGNKENEVYHEQVEAPIRSQK